MCLCVHKFSISYTKRLLVFLPKVAKLKIMKSKFIKFRVTSTEFYIIKKKANQCGVSTSEFIRSLSLDYTIKPRLKDDEINVYKMLIKYSDNFRRISNLFKIGDTSGVKELSIDTAKLIREHLQKFK